jgi:hypothetical protein
MLYNINVLLEFRMFLCGDCVRGSNLQVWVGPGGWLEYPYHVPVSQFHDSESLTVTYLCNPRIQLTTGLYSGMSLVFSSTNKMLTYQMVLVLPVPPTSLTLSPSTQTTGSALTSYLPQQVSHWPDEQHLPICFLSSSSAMPSKWPASPHYPHYPLLLPLLESPRHSHCSGSHFCLSQTTYVLTLCQLCQVYTEMPSGRERSSLQSRYCHLPYIGPIVRIKI